MENTIVENTQGLEQLFELLLMPLSNKDKKKLSKLGDVDPKHPRILGEEYTFGKIRTINGICYVAIGMEETHILTPDQKVQDLVEFAIDTLGIEVEDEE